ncbi:hypothetical protein D9M70_81770 [compost metagenome]
MVGGMVSMASSAAWGSAGGLVYADGSVGGGGLTSSSGAALTMPRLTLISITAAMPGLLKRPSDLRSVLFFILFPRDASVWLTFAKRWMQ